MDKANRLDAALTRRGFLGRVASLGAGWAAAAMLPPGKGEWDDPGRPPGGYFPGYARRVVQVHNKALTAWDFKTGYYHDAVDQEAVHATLDAGVMALTGDVSPTYAWQRLLQSYRPGEVVAVKINTNDINWGDGLINALPEVVNAVVRGLKSAGIPETSIQVYDATRPGTGDMPARYVESTLALYPDVTFVGPADSGFRGGFPEQQVSLPEIGWSGRLSDTLCAAQHLIAVPLLKAIRPDWGNSGALKLHHGTIDTPQGTHAYLHDPSSRRNPVAAINKNPHVRDKLRLIVADGLFGTWSGKHFSGRGETYSDVPAPWVTFDDQAANSMLLAVDPVAIDCVQLDLINRERRERRLPEIPHPMIDACAEAGLGLQEHSERLRYFRIQYEAVALAATSVRAKTWSDLKGDYRR